MKKQFLNPVLVLQCCGRAHWIMLSALTTAPAWHGQELERRVRQGQGRSPCGFKGRQSSGTVISQLSH